MIYDFMFRYSRRLFKYVNSILSQVYAISNSSVSEQVMAFYVSILSLFDSMYWIMWALSQITSAPDVRRAVDYIGASKDLILPVFGQQPLSIF
jgi:hypothetical protein